MKTRTRLGWIIALALGNSAAANADTVDLFDNLNLTNFGGGSVLPPDDNPGWVANQFTTGDQCLTGCTMGNITLQLNTDDQLEDLSVAGYKLEITEHGTVTGTQEELLGPVIGTMNFTVAEFGSASHTLEFTPQGKIALEANTDYWVKLSADNGSTEVEWLWETTPSGPEFWALDDSADGSGFLSNALDSNLGNNRQMMKVTAEGGVSTIPVPAAFWLMGSALIGLVARGRRKVA